MAEPQQKVIDGHLFEVHPLAFKKGRKVLLRLSNLLGPAIARLERIDVSKGLGAVLDTEIGPALGTLLSSLRDEDLEYFEEAFLEKTLVRLEGTENLVALKLNQEAVFGANYRAYLAWLAFCFTVNFGGFLPGGRTGTGAATRDGQRQAPSQ